MSTSSAVPNTARSYAAATILRPAALAPGQYVTLLLGRDAVAGSDGECVFIVTDGTGKKGNPILIERDSGKTVSASPESVWALW